MPLADTQLTVIDGLDTLVPISGFKNDQGEFVSEHLMEAGQYAGLMAAVANTTSAVTAAATTTGNITLPPGASTANNQATLNVSVGSAGEAPVANTAAGTGSVISLLKGVIATLQNPLTVILQAGTQVLGRVGLQVAGADVSTSNRVPVDGSAVTQPVSAVSLPLPAGAATSALQSSLSAATGTTGDTAYAGSGTGTLVALLKGLYNAMIAATPAGSAVIGRVGLQQSGADVTALNRIPVDAVTVTNNIVESTVTLTQGNWTSVATLDTTSRKLIVSDTVGANCVWSTNAAAVPGQGVVMSLTGAPGYYEFQAPLPVGQVYVKSSANCIITVIKG